MKKISCLLLLAIGLLAAKTPVEGQELNVGFINFKKCIETSKQGQQEKNAFEALKAQMGQTLEKTDKELAELAQKLENQDYLDSLSPKAEDELKQRFQALSQDFARYQNQYYQLLNQANYKMLQTLHETVSQAAEKVRSDKNLMLIINEDSAFAYSKSLDFTAEAIVEMNNQFENDTTTDAIASRD